MADWVGVSPHHLQREFKREVGLSPTQYLLRARLSRAAYLLVVTKNSILDIALWTGFAHHETFTRAFKRVYDLSPMAYRMSGALGTTRHVPTRNTKPSEFGDWQLSTTRIQYTRDLRLVTHRWVGPYELVPVTLWQSLIDDCTEHRIPTGNLVGLGWDDPSRCPAEQLRFDAGVVVPLDCVLQNGETTILEGRTWAVTSYVGSFANLTRAYVEIGSRLAGKEFQIAPGPAVEVYHTLEFQPHAPQQYLEIFFPVDAPERHIVDSKPAESCIVDKT